MTISSNPKGDANSVPTNDAPSIAVGVCSGFSIGYAPMQFVADTPMVIAAKLLASQGLRKLGGRTSTRFTPATT